MNIICSHLLTFRESFKNFWSKVSFIQHPKHTGGGLILKLHLKSICLALVNQSAKGTEMTDSMKT